MENTTQPSREDIFTALNPRILELVILPTEDCNFRCTYCYEDHTPGRMNPGIVAGIKKLLDRRMSDIGFLRISWFGGEPLSAKDIVLDITEHAFRRCQENGIAFASDMTSNGYSLTAPLATRLVAMKLEQYFISLAGIGENHDRLRPLSSGKGSFERIWNNLISLQNSELVRHAAAPSFRNRHRRLRRALPRG